MERLFEDGHGDVGAGLAIGRGRRIDWWPAGQSKQGVELLGDIAAGGFGLEDLPDPGPEGANQREDPVAGVEAGVGLDEDVGADAGAETVLDLGKGDAGELEAGRA